MIKQIPIQYLMAALGMLPPPSNELIGEGRNYYFDDKKIAVCFIVNPLTGLWEMDLLRMFNENQ